MIECNVTYLLRVQSQLTTQQLKNLAKVHKWAEPKKNDELLVATAEDLSTGLAILNHCNDFVLGVVDTIFPNEIDYDELAATDNGPRVDSLTLAAEEGIDSSLPSPAHTHKLTLMFAFLFLFASTARRGNALSLDPTLRICFLILRHIPGSKCDAKYIYMPPRILGMHTVWGANKRRRAPKADSYLRKSTPSVHTARAPFISIK